MRYYLKATGSACYNKGGEGTTFPKRKINLEEMLKTVGAENIRWCNQFNWKNQPKVLTFNIKEQNLVSLNTRLIILNLPLIALEKSW